MSIGIDSQAIWWVVVGAFFFGLLSKIADLTNEHGLLAPPGVSHILGPIWGAVGAALVLLSNSVAVVVVATTLYWFLRVKLDYFNHASAGVIILFAALYKAQTGGLPIDHVLWFFIWLAVSGYVNTLLKSRSQSPRLHRFLRLRLRYYLGPVVYSAIIQDPTPLIAIVCGMTGTEMATVWFDRACARGGSRLARLLHVSLPKRSRVEPIELRWATQ
jgi:hypothetical protein